MFLHHINGQMQTCEECSATVGDEECSETVSIVSDGSVIQHPDPPKPVVMWPGCPRQWQRDWWLWDDPSGCVSPATFMEWEFEKGTQREELTTFAGMLFREWLSLRHVPKLVAEARAYAEAKVK